MKANIKAFGLVGAAALACLFAIGCQDDQALGTERPHETTPVTPASNKDDTNHARVDPNTARQVNTPTPADRTGEPEDRRMVDHDATGVRAAETPLVLNGEDLTSIPDLNEPIWATGTEPESTQRTPMEKKGSSQVVGQPGQPAKNPVGAQ